MQKTTSYFSVILCNVFCGFRACACAIAIKMYLGIKIKSYYQLVASSSNSPRPHIHGTLGLVVNSRASAIMDRPNSKQLLSLNAGVRAARFRGGLAPFEFSCHSNAPRPDRLKALSPFRRSTGLLCYSQSWRCQRHHAVAPLAAAALLPPDPLP